MTEIRQHDDTIRLLHRILDAVDAEIVVAPIDNRRLIRWDALTTLLPSLSDLSQDRLRLGFRLAGSLRFLNEYVETEEDLYYADLTQLGYEWLHQSRRAEATAREGAAPRVETARRVETAPRVETARRVEATRRNYVEEEPSGFNWTRVLQLLCIGVLLVLVYFLFK